MLKETRRPSRMQNQRCRERARNMKGTSTMSLATSTWRVPTMTRKMLISSTRIARSQQLGQPTELLSQPVELDR